MKMKNAERPYMYRLLPEAHSASRIIRATAGHDAGPSTACELRAEQGCNSSVLPIRRNSARMLTNDSWTLGRTRRRRSCDCLP
jgi:hypothetical protein